MQGIFQSLENCPPVRTIPTDRPASDSVKLKCLLNDIETMSAAVRGRSGSLDGSTTQSSSPSLLISLLQPKKVGTLYDVLKALKDRER